MIPKWTPTYLNQISNLSQYPNMIPKWFQNGSKIVYATRGPPRPGQRPEARGHGNPKKIVFLLFFVFWLKTSGNFGFFLGDHFSRVESSGDQHLTMLILHVHVFFAFLTPPTSYENPRFCKTLQNPFPWDHAQMIERKILCRIALTRALYEQIRP